MGTRDDYFWWGQWSVKWQKWTITADDCLKLRCGEWTVFPEREAAEKMSTAMRRSQGHQLILLPSREGSDEASVRAAFTTRNNGSSTWLQVQYQPPTNTQINTTWTVFAFWTQSRQQNRVITEKTNIFCFYQHQTHGSILHYTLWTENSHVLVICNVFFWWITGEDGHVFKSVQCVWVNTWFTVMCRGVEI